MANIALRELALTFIVQRNMFIAQRIGSFADRAD
jgi:hypothetical protein